MAIDVGTQLGALQITALIGRGGMGEVYRARDTKLKRDVAIKILPDEFRYDAERVTRFQREAEVLASLNHPNIAAIYDLEESNGLRFLVLELVEGETLANRIRRGPLPIEEALAVAKGICDGLEAAHEKGILHRDLKPSNVVITADGRVKVLDFGLAKVLENQVTADSSNDPTISVSTPGVIIGTPAYMSPEQATGKPTDRRTDVWSFGCVLYEMLTGQRAFEREAKVGIAGGILNAEPDWSRLPPDTPKTLLRLMAAMLNRDPTHRLQHLGDLRIFFDPAFYQSAEGFPAKPRGRLALALSTLVAAFILLWVAVYSRPAQPEIDLDAIPFEIAAPGFTGNLTISPNGRLIAYVASNAGKTEIWIRSTDSVAPPRPLPETENAFGLFWAPDSRFLGFFADGKLKKIDVSTGTVQALVENVGSQAPGTWNRDGVILFSRPAKDTGGRAVIVRASGDGGTYTPITTIDPSLNETVHAFPQFLPDGRRFLFFGGRLVGVRVEPVAAYVGSLDSDTVILLADRSGPANASETFFMRYAAPEHLLFVRNGTLMANRFDANRLKLVGEAIPIAEDIGAFAASENGWLVHRRNANPAAAPTHHLLWFDRKGNPAGQAGPPSTYDHISLSLQGDRVAFDSSDSGNRDIRVMDLKKGDQSYRLTFNDAHETFPVWSPDGGQLIFASTRDGSSRIPFRLYQKSTRGTGSENLLFTSSNPAHTVLPYDWSSDEKYLIFVHQGAIKAIDLRSGGDPITILKVQSMKVQPHLSPNGRWLAYVTEERGRYQVIVQTFPDPTRGKWQVTEKGGVEPRWSRDGSELFYLALDGKLMAVPIKAGESFDYGAPVELFQTPLNALVGSSHRYDVAPGQRFLLNVPLVGPNNETNSPPITAVINWTADLNKR